MILRSNKRQVGRFAPSPTGLLHFGSLVSALASYLQIKSQEGKWLVRIEDIDPPREVTGSAVAILDELERLGLTHDGPVLYQSERSAAYDTAVKELLDSGKAFWCGCSRKDLPPSGIYPGTCRNGVPNGKSRRAVRLKVSGQIVRFNDVIQGLREEDLAASVGDFVVLRADGFPAYQLAVVVDDAFQGITDITRGMDLFTSTARQVYLQHCLELPTPAYAHHPLAVHGDGYKLGKRFGSIPVSETEPKEALYHALGFLGQAPPSGLTAPDLLSWAIENWRINDVPGHQEMPAPRRFQPG